MLAQTLRAYPAFAGFTDEELETLAAGLIKRTARKGDVIIEEGSPGTCMYILHSGTVDIIKRTEDNQLPLISRLMPGSMFGEISMLGAHIRTAKVIANETCVFFELPYEFLEEQVKVRPLLGVKVYRTIAAILSQKVGKTTSDLVSLIASSRMAALGEMTSGIAHEISNPLATIGLLAETVEERAQDPKTDREQLLEDARKIRRNVERIGKIIKGLRSVSRDAEDDPLVPTAVAEMLEETQSFCESRFKNHGIKLELPDIGPEVKIPGRGTQICQVLLNLLNNAHDAIKDLPERWVKVEVKELPGEHKLQISITDSGKGIPAHVHERIFHPFFTTKPKGKGTGLGLSISRKIVERHGGTLDIDGSCPNTRFVIQLPTVI